MSVQKQRNIVDVPLLEKETRKWVLNHSQSCNTHVTWVEPAFGSTAGAPDVWIPQGGARAGTKIGVELKIGWVEEDCVRFTMRPAQIRYHHVAAKHGERTAILVSVINNNRLLWRALLPGTQCPKSTDARVHVSKMLDATRWSEFITAINCDDLWSAE